MIINIPVGCMWHFNTHLPTHHTNRLPCGTPGRTEVFVVTDSRSGMCMTGGGQAIDKRAKTLSEKGLNQNQKRNKGMKEQKERLKSSCFSLQCPMFCLNLCTPSLSLVDFVFFSFLFCYLFDAWKNMAVHPAPLLIYSQTN